MAQRLVFILSAILVILFFWLTNYDRYFFTLHFLEGAIYLVVLLLLFYRLEEWAYLIAFFTPLFWVILTLLSGMSLGGLVALGRLLTFQRGQSPVDLVTGFILLAAVALMITCAVAIRREVWGRPGMVRVAVWSVVVVWLYYATVIGVLYRMASPGAGG